jgi:hypothetical protein
MESLLAEPALARRAIRKGIVQRPVSIAAPMSPTTQQRQAFSISA